MAIDYYLGHNTRAAIGAAANSTTNIAHTTSHDLSLEADTQEINHNDINPGSESGGFKTVISGTKSASGSSTAYVYKTGGSLSTLQAAWLAGDTMYLKWSSGASSPTITCPIVITGLQYKSEDSNVYEYTVQWKSAGVIAFA